MVHKVDGVEKLFGKILFERASLSFLSWGYSQTLKQGSPVLANQCKGKNISCWNVCAND